SSPFSVESRSVIHPPSRRHGGHGRLLLGSFGDHRLSSDEQASNRGRILQRCADHLGRIDDPLRHEIFELASLRVEAEAISVVVLDLADYHRAVFACVDCNLSRRPGERLFDHLDAMLLVFVFALQLVQRLSGAQQADTTSGEDAFLNRGPGGMHGILNAILALLPLDFRGAADADHCNTTCELGQPLLQLLTVIVGRGLLDLRLDLGDTRLNVGLLACTAHDRGVLLLDCHLLARPSILIVTFSSLLPRSADTMVPPVRIAISSSIALRRSPKPGALTAATLRPPRSLFTTRVASASPSTSSAMMRSGLPACTTASRSGSSSLRAASF